MSAIFRPATRQKVKLRMAIDGVSGSGKTFTALRMATALGKKIAVINTESGAVEKYLGLAPDGVPFQFDVCELNDFAPSKYTESILAAGASGYDVLIIDSLSHAWAGSGGALELKDRKGGNSFTAWKDITPMQNQMIEAVLRSPCHVIVTMRSKQEYVLEQDDRGRSTPRKMGMAPVQRAGMEYEFDIYCSIDSEHIMRVSKSRCPEVADALTVKPGAAFMEPVLKWLNDGSDASADKFAVTEADLQKLARVEAADLPPAPKKTAAELMAEAAAKATASQPGVEQVAVQAAPATSTATVQPTTAPTPGSELESSKGQRELIEKLFDQLNASPEDRIRIIKKRGVQALRSFNFAQAGELIAALERKLKELNATASNLVDTSGAASDSGVHSVNGKNPGTATIEQVTQIKSELDQWEQLQPGVVADFIARLQSSGVFKIADLSFADASDLLGAIQIKNIAGFFERELAGASA
jgi:hypothetical protein